MGVVGEEREREKENSFGFFCASVKKKQNSCSFFSIFLLEARGLEGERERRERRRERETKQSDFDQPRKREKEQFFNCIF